MTWELDGRPLRRILVTRLRYLGDIAMATVVLDVLRRGDPDLTLAFLCEDTYAPVLSAHPLLTRVHPLRTRRRGGDARARHAMPGRSATMGGGTLATIAALRRGHYDAAIDLFFNPRSAWLLALAGVPARVGGATGSRRRLYTHAAPAPASALAGVVAGGLGDHLARLAPLQQRESGLDALAWIRAHVAPRTLHPRVAIPPPTPAVIGALARLGAAPGAFTLLAPAATWPTKAWPAAHWHALARRLQATGAGPLVVLAPPGDADTYAGLPGLLPPLPLAEALEVVGAAARLVSVDGGIMHAAVAMGVPTLALFGPTDPRIWFPYEDIGPYRVLATRPACFPCDRHTCDAFICLPDLAPDRVADALAALPARGGAP